MSDEREFQEHKRDLLAAAENLGVPLTESQVETRLRYVQARGEEHDLSMAEVERDDLRRIILHGARRT